jgi:hypothetical protein
MTMKLQIELEELTRTLHELLDYLPFDVYSEFGRDAHVLRGFQTELNNALTELRKARDREYNINNKGLDLVKAYSRLKDSLRVALKFVIEVEAKRWGNLENTQKMRNLILSCLTNVRNLMKLEELPLPDDISSSPWEEYRRSLVRFYDRNDRGRLPIGLGLLMPNGQILSCAHVVSRTFQVKYDPKERPEGDIIVDFIFPMVSCPEICLELVDWCPLENSDPLDIALLKIKSPQGVRLGKNLFVEEFEPWEDRFRMYGFPEGNPGGAWTKGQILDIQGDGLLQIEDTGNFGYRVQGGFSGSPVWSVTFRGIVGILVATDPNLDNRTGFAIPVKKLRRYANFV